MKKKNIYFGNLLLFIMAAVIGFSSCKKNFDKINTDPNSPKDIPTSYLLTGAQKGLMDQNWDEFWGAQVGNQLAQYWSSNQYTSESRYLFRTGITSNYWGYFYAGGINNAAIDVGGIEELMQIIRLCEEDPGKYSAYGYPDNQIAVATILKVWQMQRITDTWGDAPYSEAWQGVANTQPKYDSQRDIYMGLINELKDALARMDETEAGPAGDVIYSGDMSKWRKFGNSLMLRVAIRISDRESSMASQLINDAIAGGVFTGNDDDALFRYLTSQPSTNPLYYNYAIDGRNDYCASNTMIDVMTALNDPRMSIYYEPAEATGTFIGEVYGLTEANGSQTEIEDVSQRGNTVLAADAPGVFMSYSEVQFILAEAAARGYIGGSAESYYEEGIRASMAFWGITNNGDINSYINHSGVKYSTLIGSMSYKQVIGKQKWLALYMQGIEGWTEWRRLDFGILQLPANGILDGTTIPYRLKYPVDEQTLNGTSYNAAIASQGADNQQTKVWWDLN